LGSEQWAADYNEIKDFGGKASTRRSARQTEDARFWLITGPVAYHPIARQLVVSRKMDVMDSARFMALVAVAEADAYIAVMDGKYHYDFWRPITAIRNANLSGNPAVAPEAGWQPIDNTHRWTNLWAMTKESFGGTHLGRLPLQVFDSHGRRYGPQSWAIRCAKCSKAGEGGRGAVSPISLVFEGSVRLAPPRFLRRSSCAR
jgi:hypothetical protein